MGVYRNWFLASRPWSFTMTAISVSVGSAAAAVGGDFSWVLFGITLVSAVLMHAATNLINDFYDVGSGVDFHEVSTAQYRPHPLLEGRLKPEQVRAGAYLVYGVAAAIGVYLAAVRGWSLLVLGLIGLSASLAYTAPPMKYKYHALGEVSVFLMWGPLMVSGSYFVQRQAFSLDALWISIPFGVLVALVLLANNIRDIRHDQSKGIRTLPIAMGERNAIRLYGALVGAAYLAVVWMSVWGPLRAWSLLVLLSLPLALRLLQQMTHRIPVDADAQTARLDTVFGSLLVLSLILEGAF